MSGYLKLKRRAALRMFLYHLQTSSERKLEPEEALAVEHARNCADAQEQCLAAMEVLASAGPLLDSIVAVFEWLLAHAPEIIQILLIIFRHHRQHE